MAAKKTARKAPKKAVKKSAKKSVAKAAKKSTARKAVKKTAKKSAKRSTKSTATFKVPPVPVSGSSRSSVSSISTTPKPASSTSEIVANLIKESAFPVNEDIATNLLAGIEEQSKNFQSSEVTADTFEIFAELLKIGGRRMPKIVPARSYPQGSIPTQPFTSRPVMNNNSKPVIENTVDKFMSANNPVNSVPQPLIHDKQMTLS